MRIPTVFRFAAFWCAGLLGTLECPAADWPRLGGLDGAGFSSESNLARAWPAAGPRVLWTIQVGQGFAGAAVFQGEVFLLDRVANQRDILRCLDLNTGRERWTFGYDAPGTLPYNGSRNVPTVDAQFVFTIGPFGHLHCLDRRTHQVVWAKHLIHDFQDPEIDRAGPAETREQQLARTQVPRWGVAQAPLLYRDTVIVAPQTQKTGLVAFERTTGKIRWRSGYIGRNWFSSVSPTLMNLGGVEQVIMLGQPSDPEKAPSQAPPAIISSVDPITGRILWMTKTVAPHKIPVPQPLALGTNRLFITGGYGHGTLILEVAREGDQWNTKVVLQNKTVAGHIHSPVLYRDRIYVTSLKEQGGKQTGLVCLTPDGEPLWQTGPVQQFENGGLLIADGLAYVMHGRTGELHLFDLSSAPARLLAKAKVLRAEDAMVWAPMALSDGKLLIRDQHELKCLDVRSPRIDRDGVPPGKE